MPEMTGEDARFQLRVRTLRLIVLSLMMGISAFLVVVVLVVQQRQANPNAGDLITYCAIVFFVLMTTAWQFIPDLLTKSALKRIANDTWTPGSDRSGQPLPAGDYPTDESKLLVVFQLRTVVALALLEGAAFLGCLAYMVETHAMVLAIPLFVLAFMVLTFPRRERIIRWLEMQQQALQELRASEHTLGK